MSTHQSKECIGFLVTEYSVDHPDDVHSILLPLLPVPCSLFPKKMYFT
ncbi:hypothetical protein [Moorena producens]|nr:hypothetical protein [Moorena producens]